MTTRDIQIQQAIFDMEYDVKGMAERFVDLQEENKKLKIQLFENNKAVD